MSGRRWVLLGQWPGPSLAPRLASATLPRRPSRQRGPAFNPTRSAHPTPEGAVGAGRRDRDPSRDADASRRTGRAYI